MQRGKLLGKVVDQAGKAIAGAAVTLRSHAWHGRPEWGSVDERQATTGDRGQFRVKLIPGRGYSAWARLPGKPGAWTEIDDEVALGRRLTLYADASKRRRVRVRVVGLDGWKRLGPFRYECSSAALNFVRSEVQPDHDGLLLLPDWPGSMLAVTIRDRNGEAIAHEWFSNKAEAPILDWRGESIHPGRRPDEPKPSKTEPGVMRWVIPAAVKVLFRVEAAEAAGVGIAGARISMPFAPAPSSSKRMREGRTAIEVKRLIGECDSRGVLHATIPLTKRKFGRLFQVEAPGRMLTAAALNPHPNRMWRVKPRQDGGVEVTVRLKRARTLQGRVVDASGKGVKGVRLRYKRRLLMRADENGSSSYHMLPGFTETNEDGSFLVTSPDVTGHAVLALVPSPEQLKRLVPELRQAPLDRCPAIPLVALSQNDRRLKYDFGKIGDDLRLLRFRVTSNGRPASYARFLQLPKVDWELARTDNGVSDANGVAHVIVTPAAKRVFIWSEAAGYRFYELTEDGSRDGTDIIVDALTPFRWVTATVLDDEGKPWPFALLRKNAEGWSGKSWDHPFAEIQLNHMFRALRADRFGRIRYPFLPAKGWEVGLAAAFMHRGNLRWGTSLKTAAPDEDISGLTFTIKRPTR